MIAQQRRQVEVQFPSIDTSADVFLVAGDLATVAGGAGVEKGAGYWAVLILGLVATVGVTMLVTRASRRALHQAEDG